MKSIAANEDALIRMIERFAQNRQSISYGASRINGRLPKGVAAALDRICGAAVRLTRQRQEAITGGRGLEYAAEIMAKELREVLEWAKIEKAPLREIEIKSIESVLSTYVAATGRGN